MAITVQDLFSLKSFQDAKIVGGNGGSHRIVQLVNIMDAPDIGEWIKGGELLLTTGYSIKHESLWQQNFISLLAEKGCAALGIKTKRFFEDIPQTIIKTADKVNLPVIELAYNISFEQIINEVMNNIFLSQDVRKNIRMRLLIDKIINNNDIEEIVNLLGEILKSKVVLVSPLLSDIVTNNHPGPISELIDNTKNSGLSGEELYAIHHLEGGSQLIQAAIGLPHDLFGFLYVLLGIERDEQGIDIKQIINYTVMSLTFLLNKTKNERIIIDKLYNYAIACLLENGYLPNKLLEKKREITFSKGLRIILVEINAEENLKEVIALVACAARLSVGSDNFIVGDYENKVILLIWGREYKETHNLRQVLNTIRKHISNNEVYTAWIVSEHLSSPSLVPQAYRELCDIISYGREIANKTLCIEDLGPLRNLRLAQAEKALKGLQQKILGNLLRKGNSQNEELLETLIVYFRCNECINETAAVLHLHRNSLRYRLERIKEILGLDPFVSRDKALLVLGLQAHNLLKEKE